MINWIKDNWKDPVWSKVFAWLITGIIALILSGFWILIQLLFRQISLQDSLIEFLRLINLKVPIPLWLIILSLITVAVFILKKRLKRNNNSTKHVGKELTKSKNADNKKLLLENTNIGLAKQGYNSSLNSKFLGLNKGIFSIWGHVSDIHNRVHPQGRNMYIIGYATNGGNPLNNPNLSVYPNAWAIVRITPTVNDNIGAWRFWCNNISKDSTNLDYKKPLSGGWHLFTVAWSSEENYIKFIIDTEIVAEDKYINWPSDYSESVLIGTWPNRAGTHYFDSKIGPFRLIESKYDKELIADYFNNKPE